VIDFLEKGGTKSLKGTWSLNIDMEDQMKEDNEVQRVMREKTMTWVGILAVVILLSLSLGGLIYAFVVTVP
jgi:hypothetical protein